MAEILWTFDVTLGQKSINNPANSVHKQLRKDVYDATFEGKIQQPKLKGQALFITICNDYTAVTIRWHDGVEDKQTSNPAWSRRAAGPPCRGTQSRSPAPRARTDKELRVDSNFQVESS